MDRSDQAKAIASEPRMRILHWLKDPSAHFSHQETGDPEEIGVCVTLLSEKLAMSQPTVSRHLELLRRAGFLTVNHIGRWSFFSRDERAIAEYRRWLDDNL